MSACSSRPDKAYSSKRLIVMIALLMLAPIGGRIIWLYWRCNFYRDPVLQQLRAKGCIIEQHSLTPILAGVLEAPILACGDARIVKVPAGSLDDELAPLIGRCSQIHLLDAPEAVLSEKGVDSWVAISPYVDIILSNAELSVGCLPALGRIPKLRWLSLSHAKLTQDNMRELTALTSVIILSLDATAITDADMQYVARMPSLASLDISDTAITSKGLAYLKASKTLTYIRAANTMLSKDDVNELKSARPEIWLRLD